MPNDLAIRHLLIRLRPINRALRAAVERQAAEAAQLDRPDLVPYCITDEQVAALLDRLDALPLAGGTGAASLTPEEQAAEQQIREQASAAGVVLPLDELVGRLGLTGPEQQALLLCAAPELDRAYERVIAYVLDDLNRRFPCVELLTLITSGSGLGGLTERGVLSRSGRLRLLGLLTPYGEAPTHLRQELRVPSGVVDYLLGHGGDLAVLAHDPGAVPIPETVAIPPQLDAAHLDRLGKAIRAGDVDLIGVWGSLRAGQREAVYALARAAGLPLRQRVGARIEDALNVAAALECILWLPMDDIDPDVALTRLLARSRTPVFLSGTEPWRPSAVLSVRMYSEIVVTRPSYRDREAMWARALPGLDSQSAATLAARYRASEEELRAVASLACGDIQASDLTDDRQEDEGHSATCNVARAISAVTSGPVAGLAHAITPRRRPETLVLPPAEQQMVLELVAAFRAWPRVAEEWGFAQHGGAGGIKALFTGEPGTGKTLAAEVIAGMLGLTLLKVDLSQVVSKWVGETEKNLESVFRQAENSQALLFFDEADALFGRRMQVNDAHDRFANIEVDYLLQRMEEFDGVAVLATNRKGDIDTAFMRRLRFVIDFAPPTVAERERIWRAALEASRDGDGTPLTESLDWQALARNLDLTGAGIKSTALGAAFLARSEGSRIATRHIFAAARRELEKQGVVVRAGRLENAKGDGHNGNGAGKPLSAGEIEQMVNGALR
jgi:hypothetical protein